MGDKGNKRQASPLESQYMKRRSDKVYASHGTSRAWITVEKPSEREKYREKQATRRGATWRKGSGIHPHYGKSKKFGVVIL